MSYGHRLNIEDIFFELAERNYSIASGLAGMVRHDSDDGLQDHSFRGYPTDEGLAAASVAVVGWATALEAFTNLAWNEKIADSLPEGKIRDMVIKQLSTPEKLGEVFRSFQVDLGLLIWWPNIKNLFQLRNELVHYRHQVVYQGFCFAPVISRKLTEASLVAVREAAISAIRELGIRCNLRTGFLDGDYEIATINA
jgi:hypothetical protein